MGNLKNRKRAALFEMFVLVCASFAFAYLIKESSKGFDIGEFVIVQKRDSRNLKDVAYRIVNFFSNIIGGFQLASAAGDSGEERVSTCVLAKNGAICQQFPNEDCDSLCTSICIPSTSDAVDQCRLGTCYFATNGLCQVNSPKARCGQENGIWFSDPNGNIRECMKACCILRDRTDLMTDRECALAAWAQGIQKNFREDIKNSLTCVSLALTEERGACVIRDSSDSSLKPSCKFANREQCQSLRGEFYSNILCSSPSLNTRCEPQKTVGCAPDNERNIHEEVYWYDSCGNRENIYDSDKVKSFNGGKVFAKEQSCSLKVGSNSFANQKTCGNCNRLLGSVCNRKTTTEKLADPNHEVVCRSTECVDEQGKKRNYGESWCVYQGAIGVNNGTSTERSVDTVGSRHFRRSCVNGEVITEPCYDYRKGICVESKTQLPEGGTFSTASCRINRAMECFDYNNNEVKKQQCTLNPDCFIKKVDVSDKFKFEFCVPKYKPGFNLEDTGNFEETICKLGTQTCKYIKVKGLFKDKKVNEECTKEKFTKQMNDFCMSLGDCGAQVNYLGTLSKSYKVENAPELSQSYLADIARYANENLFKGQVADPGKPEDYYSNLGLGIPGDLGSAQTPKDSTKGTVSSISMVAGAIGVLLPMAAHYGITIPLLATKVAALSHAGVAYAGPSSFISSSVTPALTALGGALVGAAIGVAIVGLLLSWTGVGRGLPPAAVYSLMAVGALGGAMIGAHLMASSTSLFAAAAFAVVGLILVVVVIIIIIILKLIGIGKVKTVDVKFTCMPWQAPTGVKESDCGKCGSDGLSCSAYACSSLGQNCKLVNEDDPDNIACVRVAPDDVTPPVIKSLDGVLPSNYRYELLPQGAGMRVLTGDSDGCFRQTYSSVFFGVALDEPGQCKMDEKPLTSFDSMRDYFTGRNKFLVNHTAPLSIPSLASLGYSGFDPYAKVNTTFYVRCQDKNGNKNERDYAVSFCIKQGPDYSPPIITSRDPVLEEIAFTKTTVNATVFVNEPADCRWDVIDAKNYSKLANEMECWNEVEDQTINGFPCYAVFPITKNESSFYIRCLDQPWLTGENASKRNEMNPSYNFTLKKVSSPLKISSISPENVSIKFSTEPGTIEVVVKTSGGLDNTATCYFNSSGNLVPFYETLGSTHRQVFNQMREGTTNFQVVCQDQVGNLAGRKAWVKVNIDNDLPRITRVYREGNALFVVTDEPATCVYGSSKTKKCTYEFSNGTLMQGNDVLHSTSFDGSIPYYIKCKDVFENGALSDSCGIALREGEL